jgi:hypothetical protein
MVVTEALFLVAAEMSSGDQFFRLLEDGHRLAAGDGTEQVKGDGRRQQRGEQDEIAPVVSLFGDKFHRAAVKMRVVLGCGVVRHPRQIYNNNQGMSIVSASLRLEKNEAVRLTIGFFPLRSFILSCGSFCQYAREPL